MGNFSPVSPTMQKVALFLAVIAAVAFIASPVAAEPVAAADSEYLNWDFLVLRLMWPGSVSGGAKLPYEIQNFTLHGLWPTNNDTSGPSYCTKEAFSESKIESLLPQMDVVWKSLWPDSNGNEQFWSHEWGKHGTCASELYSLNSQYKFFAGALGVKYNTPVLDTLTSAGIYPSNDDTYTLDDIKGALTSAGLPPLVFCQEPSDDSDDSTPQLQALEFCVDTSLNIYECDEAMQKRAASGGHCWADAISIPKINH